MQEQNNNRTPTIEECIQECTLLAPELKSVLFGGPDKDGTLWQPIGGLPFSPAYLRFFHMAWFNKVQRWQADYLYRVNGYAQSAVDNLVTMTMGCGFQYDCENDSLQNRLDGFLHKTKWKSRSREAFIRLLVHGECFFRIFDDELRFVDADHVYDSENMGIKTSETDYEEVQSYTINGERVSPDEVQHRKLALSGEKRGTSLLFSISSHLMAAEQLLHNLTRTADVQSRFAVVRSHKANAAAVQVFKSGIQAGERGQGLQRGLEGHRENYEAYEPGSMVDSADSVDWNFPGSAIDAEKYVAVLRAVLRLCAARVGLPENILSQDQDSMGAYNSSLVADGHSTKAMEVWQQRLAEYDLDLFEKCGFDSSKIKVVAPEIALHEKSQTVLEAGFLKTNRMASDQTIAAMFGIDLAAEIEIQPDLADRTPQPAGQKPDADQGGENSPKGTAASSEGGSIDKGTEDRPQEDNAVT